MDNKDIEEFIPTINGWEPDTECESGSLFWSNKNNEHVVIYATPNWNVDNEVEITVCNRDGDYKPLGKFTVFGDTTTQIRIYKAMLTFAIDEVDKWHK